VLYADLLDDENLKHSAVICLELKKNRCSLFKPGEID